MTKARKTVVSKDKSGVYHCVSRCVRRAFLCGRDAYSGKDYEHRREWVRERLRELSGLFGAEVFAYAVMSNHTHVVLRTRPDWVESWSAEEVSERWCRLFRGKKAQLEGKAFDEGKYERMRKDPEQVRLCRGRLKDLSWFMRCLNENLARRANREDRCTGRFCARIRPEGTRLQAPCRLWRPGTSSLRSMHHLRAAALRGKGASSASA
jgi:REP element-mobilizing transposase RayT